MHKTAWIFSLLFDLLSDHGYMSYVPVIFCIVPLLWDHFWDCHCKIQATKYPRFGGAPASAGSLDTHLTAQITRAFSWAWALWEWWCPPAELVGRRWAGMCVKKHNKSVSCKGKGRQQGTYDRRDIFEAWGLIFLAFSRQSVGYVSHPPVKVKCVKGKHSYQSQFLICYFLFKGHFCNNDLIRHAISFYLSFARRILSTTKTKHIPFQDRFAK